jgi:hypothetical protein
MQINVFNFPDFFKSFPNFLNSFRRSKKRKDEPAPEQEGLSNEDGDLYAPLENADLSPEAQALNDADLSPEVQALHNAQLDKKGG